MAYQLKGVFRLANDYLSSTPHLSLKAVSQKTGVERHTIEKAVKAATGMTFRELRNSMMMKKARNLLENEANRSIKEIAFLLNYRSHRAFSRFVRTMEGQSPSDLRKTHLDS